MKTLFRSACLVLGVVIGGAGALAPPAVAQPGGMPAPPPAPEAPAEAPMIAPDPGQPSYDAGFAAMVAGDFATARTQLAAAAERATSPELRSAALELARLADQLLGRQARLVIGAGPLGVDEGEDPADGRTSFIVTTTLWSLYAGVVLIDVLDVDDVRGGAALVLSSTAAGFLGSLFGSRDRSISGGMAEAYSTGALIGVTNGLLLAEPLGAERSEVFQVSALTGLLLGGGAGLVYGDRVRPTRGQMSFVGTMATLGLATAGLGLVITAPDVSADSVLYTMTAGLDLGAAAGLVLGKDLTWSSGRARLVWLGALLGGVAGFGTSLLIGGDDGGDDYGRVAAGVTLAGTWGGFLLAARLTGGMRPDRRYRTPPAVTAELLPIAVPHGAGLGVVGGW